MKWFSILFICFLLSHSSSALTATDTFKAKMQLIYIDSPEYEEQEFPPSDLNGYKGYKPPKKYMILAELYDSIWSAPVKIVFIMYGSAISGLRLKNYYDVVFKRERDSVNNFRSRSRMKINDSEYVSFSLEDLPTVGYQYSLRESDYERFTLLKAVKCKRR